MQANESTRKSRGFNLLFAIALDRARGVRPGRRPAHGVSPPLVAESRTRSATPGARL